MPAQRRRGEGAGGDDGRSPCGRWQTADLGPFDGDRRMRGEARLDRFEPTRSTAKAEPAGTRCIGGRHDQ